MDTNTFNSILRAALLADAHAMPLHWNYEPDKIDALLSEKKVLLDRLNNGDESNYFKGKKVGELSHLGDQIIHLHNYIKSHKKFEVDSYVSEWERYINSYEWHKDHSTKITLEHITFGIQPTGADNTDFCGTTNSLPILSLFLDDEKKAIELACTRTKMTHNNTLITDSVKWLFQALFRINEGNNVSRSMDMAAQNINNPVFQKIYNTGKNLTTRKEPIPELIKEVGIGCAIDVGLPILMVLIERHQNNFEEFMIENTKAGADSAPRALVGGALLGAMKHTVIPEHLYSQLQAKL